MAQKPVLQVDRVTLTANEAQEILGRLGSLPFNAVAPVFEIFQRAAQRTAQAMSTESQACSDAPEAVATAAAGNNGDGKE